MPVQVQMPVQKESSLDKIARGLQIAQTVYGIKADMSAIERAKAEEEAAAQNRQREMALRAEYEAPDSVLYQSIANRAKAAGIQIPKGMNYRQAKDAGLLGAIEAREKALTDRETAIAKAKIDRETELAKAGQLKAPTADQYKVAGFTKRAENAEKSLNKLLATGYDPTSGSSMADIQSVGMFPERAKSGNFKQYQTAQRNFVSAVLRRESGAAISPTEFETEVAKYFPMVGDTPEVLADKEQARLQAIAGLKAEAGSAYAMVPTVPKKDPNLIAGAGGDGLFNEANAGPGRTMLTQEDLDHAQEALNRLKVNPNDQVAQAAARILRNKGLDITKLLQEGEGQVGR